MLPGNHDMTNKRDTFVNTIAAYAAHPKITVIEKPTVMEIIAGVPCVFVPYNEDPNTILEAALRLSERDAWLFSHLDVVGARAGIDGYVMKTGLDLTALDKYAGGILGHFHTPQDLSSRQNFCYVGSPMQLHWCNAGTDHGAIIWRPGDAEMAFEELDAPRFFEFDGGTDAYPPAVLPSCTTNDYFRITCQSLEQAAEFRRLWEGWNLVLETVLPEKAEAHAALKGSTHHEMLDEYMTERSGVCELELADLLSWSNFYLQEAEGK
jgi:DNA repair exonuclease SbcCD nuclease subunit